MQSISEDILFIATRITYIFIKQGLDMHIDINNGSN